MYAEFRALSICYIMREERMRPSSLESVCALELSVKVVAHGLLDRLQVFVLVGIVETLKD